MDNIKEKIAKNLGITDIGAGTYLATLIDGLSAVNKMAQDRTDAIIADLSLETASLEALERYGAEHGAPRIVAKSAITRGFLREASIEVERFVEDGTSLLLFMKGDKLRVDVLDITFTDDVLCKNKSYISCEITPAKGSLKGYLSKGSSFNIQVPLKLQNIVKSLTLRIEESLAFSSIDEDTETYRKRLIALRDASNVSAEETMKKVLAASYGLYKYHIDKSSYPYILYYLNPISYYDTFLDLYATDIEPHLKHSIDSIRSYATSIELKTPEPVSFKINMLVPQDDKLIKAMEKFTASFLVKHTLGAPLVINKTYIENFLTEAEIALPFNVEFYYSAKGLDFKTPEVKIESTQYPKLITVTYNEEY